MNWLVVDKGKMPIPDQIVPGILLSNIFKMQLMSLDRNFF